LHAARVIPGRRQKKKTFVKTLLRIVGGIVGAIIVASGGLVVLMEIEFRTTRRELKPSETRQMVKDMTGRDLPTDAQALRGIYVHSRAIDDDVEYVFVAFQAGPEAQTYMHETSGNDHVTEFPDRENPPGDIRGLIVEMAFRYQKRGDVPPFDRNLLERVKQEAIDGLMAESFPADAVRGYRLEARVDSQTDYEVFVFTDRNLVYLGISKDNVPKGPPQGETPSIEEHKERINMGLHKVDQSI
jgi:hypothetical protein